MKIWAAKNSVLKSINGEHPKKTLSGIVTPTFRKSPTDYSALYTALKLCTDVNSVVV